MARKTPKKKKVKGDKIEVEENPTVFDKFFAEAERAGLIERKIRLITQKAEFEDEILNIQDDIDSWNTVIAQLPPP